MHSRIIKINQYFVCFRVQVSGTAQRQISQEELDALCQTLDDIRGKYVKDLSLRSSRELFGDGTDEPDSRYVLINSNRILSFSHIRKSLFHCHTMHYILSTQDFKVLLTKQYFITVNVHLCKYFK